MERVQKETRPVDPYNIQIMPAAQRGIAALSKGNRKLVAEAIDDLELDPRPAELSIPLVTGNGLRRLTVGDYRVIYGIDEVHRTIWVEMVRHRKDVYEKITDIADAAKGKYKK